MIGLMIWYRRPQWSPSLEGASAAAAEVSFELGFTFALDAVSIKWQTLDVGGAVWNLEKRESPFASNSSFIFELGGIGVPRFVLGARGGSLSSLRAFVRPLLPPLDGVWRLSRQGWSSCTSSCGVGTQRLTRSCDPPARYGGALCSGNSTLLRECRSEAACGTDFAMLLTVG